jgi:hypothetical protein
MATLAALVSPPAHQADNLVTAMENLAPDLSRISKIFVDRDQEAPDSALARRQKFSVVLACGVDVSQSYGLQLAVITAARILTRCFPGAVKINATPNLMAAPLLLWPWRNISFGDAIAEIVGSLAAPESDQVAHTIVFGDVDASGRALRVTFDGWLAKVGPVLQTPRLQERNFCPLAGVLAAALAASELFLEFAELNIAAGRRAIGLSLWRPDLAIDDARAVGVPVQFLPQDLWLLGLGHLGNAYIWALATLPYVDPRNVTFYLTDFDKVESANVETGLLFKSPDVRRFKTRVCSTWLEALAFHTRLNERPFDASFRRQESEPGLALAGFDSNAVRRDLPHAGFLRVIDTGLGGNAANFDTISLHALPNPRSAPELWPDADAETQLQVNAHHDDVARNNAGYAGIDDDICGRIRLSGKSVAVPFVGAAAACLAVAEILRLLHGGRRYDDIRLSLSNINNAKIVSVDGYQVEDIVGFGYLDLGAG